MTVKIGHAFCDERGKARGGEAGDQTGREVRIQDFYVRDGGWGVYIEPLNASLGAKAADRMIAICENDNIGYDQDERWTARTAVQLAGSIEAAGPSEVDCSSAIDIAYEAAGLKVDRGYTRNLERRYLATGKIKEYRDAAHLASGDYARKGGIFLTAGKHVAMVLTDGPKVGLSVPENTDTAKTPAGTKVPRIRQADGVEAPYVLAIQNVRVRTGPSTKYSSIGYIKQGTMVAYGDTDPDNGWHAVDTADGPGFVSGNPSFTKLVT